MLVAMVTSLLQAFAWLGFAVSIVWIYSIANEIVNLLQVFGIVMKLSDGILGLTLLAWGNSCLLYTSPSPRDATLSRMPSSA